MSDDKLTAHDLLIKAWNDYVHEKALQLESASEVGVTAQLVAESYRKIVDVRRALTEMYDSLDAIEGVLKEWEKTGELTGRIAAMRARKMCGIKREDQSEN